MAADTHPLSNHKVSTSRRSIEGPRPRKPGPPTAQQSPQRLPHLTGSQIPAQPRFHDMVRDMNKRHLVGFLRPRRTRMML